MEQDDIKRKKLEKFKEEVIKDRMVEWWTNKEDLASKVTLALAKQIARMPRLGWVRSNSIMSGNSDKVVEKTAEVLDVSNPQYKTKDVKKYESENESFNGISEKEPEEIDYFERFNILKKHVSKKAPSVERDEFIQKSYEQIVEWVIKVGEQYERENEDIVLRVNKVNTVVAILYFYKKRKLIRTLKIFLDSMYVDSEKSIMVSQNEVVSAGTAFYDGVYDVRIDENKMKLFATVSMLHSQKYMTTEEIVADIWESYIQPYL